jgi:hypothetical protein
MDRDSERHRTVARPAPFAVAITVPISGHGSFLLQVLLLWAVQTAVLLPSCRESSPWWSWASKSVRWGPAARVVRHRRALSIRQPPAHPHACQRGVVQEIAISGKPLSRLDCYPFSSSKDHVSGPQRRIPWTTSSNRVLSPRLWKLDGFGTCRSHQRLCGSSTASSHPDVIRSSLNCTPRCVPAQRRRATVYRCTS